MSGADSSASLHRSLSSHEPALVTSVSISPGNRVTLSVTFEADKQHIDGCWWVVAQSVDVLASALDFYGLCPFQSFSVAFAGCRSLLSARRLTERKSAYDRLVHAPLPD